MFWTTRNCLYFLFCLVDVFQIIQSFQSFSSTSSILPVPIVIRPRISHTSYSYSSSFSFQLKASEVSNFPINDEIEAEEVRVLVAGKDGQKDEMIGILPIHEAQTLAEKLGLDLVCINAAINPPICKIIDYGKFRFEYGKKERAQNKKQRAIELKDIHIAFTTESRDLETKIKRAQDFIKGGDRVSIV